MAMIDVNECRAQDAERWNDYVARAGSATFFQLHGWQHLLESIFGLETHYLYAEREGEIAGILPLYRVNSLLFGHYFSSLPGGLYAADNDVAVALADNAIQLTRDRKASYLLLRDSRNEWHIPKLQVDTSHCTLVVQLGRNLEQMWSGIRNEERRVINQARLKGVVAETNPECLEALYPFYLQAMRAQGTPPYSMAFFQALRIAFPSNITLQVVRIDDRVFAGGLIAPFKHTVLCTWAAIPPRYYHLRPSHLLLWKAMEFASENGYSQVDFGRSRQGSGGYNFKQKWGAEPVALYQYYYLNGVSAPPTVGNEYRDDRRFRFFTTLWRHLPLSMTRVVGAHVRRHIPFG